MRIGPSKQTRTVSGKKAFSTVLNLPEDGKWSMLSSQGSRTVAGNQSREWLTGCHGDPSPEFQREVETKAATPALPLSEHYHSMCYHGIVGGQRGQNAAGCMVALSNPLLASRRPVSSTTSSDDCVG